MLEAPYNISLTESLRGTPPPPAPPRIPEQSGSYAFGREPEKPDRNKRPRGLGVDGTIEMGFRMRGLGFRGSGFR